MARSGQKIDYYLALAILALVVLGVVLITSIGVPKSIQLTNQAGTLFPQCGVDGVDCFLLIKNHLGRLIMAGVVFFVCLKIPFSFWRRIAVPLFLTTFIVLLLVLISGKAFNTFAQSWLVLWDRFSLQPTEFAKLGLIFYLSVWLSQKGQEIKDFQHGFLSYAVLVGIITLPIILQPDLGGTFVFLIIACGLYFIAGAPTRHILTGFAIFLLVFLMAVTVLPQQRSRIFAFVNPSPSNCQRSIEDEQRDFCWQSNQANIAIGTGGFWGRGLTRGVQKSYWLPQAADDFIFAASAEELGFLRITMVLGLFMFIAYRGFLIARFAPDKFSMFLAAGITLWIVGQAAVNIGVNIGFVPITGLTLPLISYGGSSLIATMAGLGILLNISKYSNGYVPITTNRRRDRRPHYSQRGTL